MQKKSQIFSARISHKRFPVCQWDFLAILGCSRMLLAFGTSQSNTNFLWNITRLQSIEVSENRSFSQSVVRLFSWEWIYHLFWSICLKFCSFKGVWNLDFLSLNRIIDKFIKTRVVFWNQLECVKAFFHCHLQPMCWQSQRSSNQTNECTLQVEFWNRNKLQTKQILVTLCR